MGGLLLAVLASVGWGTTGMLAGRASRRLPPLHVAMALEWSGLAMIAVVLAVVHPPIRGGTDLALALCAGIAGALGNVLTYAALSVGAMGLVAPVAASGAAITVIGFGVAGGDRPAPLAIAGMAAALIAEKMAEAHADAAMKADDKEAVKKAMEKLKDEIDKK